MQEAAHPIIFKPIFKQKIWGGRKLEACVHKTLPADVAIGESWEVADLEDDQSLVADGPSMGQSISSLVQRWGVSLLGEAPLFEGRFPLLIKFLDATETLSVQVHPDEETARRLGGRVRVKNEAWYIIDAEPGGFIYRGLKKGVGAPALKKAIADASIESVLQRISVRKGHCYYLPSGTIHALGAGVTVAEIQTPSDITYRVYDWNRVEASTGRPRELHLEQALGCISFEERSFVEEKRQHVASVWTAITRLIECPSFVIERVRMVDGVEHGLTDREMMIWIVLEGRGEIACDGCEQPVAFGVGDTVVVPAALRGGRVRTLDDCMWLEVTIPIPSSLRGFSRPAAASLVVPTNHYIPLSVPSGGSEQPEVDS